MKRPDGCPGVLRPHLAEDGAMVRLRLPGGRTTGPTLGAVSAIAERHGSGLLQLTSRAGLQIRGLPDPLPSDLTVALRAVGLLPSTTHERVRNIVVSPLTGLGGGLADLRPMITELDAAIQATPELAELSGRFLFVLDDGRGDVASTGFDLGYRATGPDRGIVMIGSPGRGFAVTARAAVGTLVEMAADFVEASRGTGAWHVEELSGWPDRADMGPLESRASQRFVPLGRVAGAAAVQVPLGLLSPAQARTAAAVAQDEVVITPWRGLVVPAAADRLADLVAAGLVAEPTSGWAMLTACVGAPWCGRSEIDTVGLARRLVAAGEVTGRTHISGCARGCGSPAGDHLALGAAR